MKLTKRQEYHAKKFKQALKTIPDHLSKNAPIRALLDSFDVDLESGLELGLCDKCMLVVDAIYHAFKFQKPRFIIGLLLFVGMLLMALFTPYNGVKFIAKDIKCIVFNFLFWAMGVLALSLLIYSMVKPVVGYRIIMPLEEVGEGKELVVCAELSKELQKLVSDLGSGATSP